MAVCGPAAFGEKLREADVRGAPHGHDRNRPIDAIHSDEAPTVDLLWFEELERAAETNFKQSTEAVFAGKASMGVKVMQAIRQPY